MLCVLRLHLGHLLTWCWTVSGFSFFLTLNQFYLIFLLNISITLRFPIQPLYYLLLSAGLVQEPGASTATCVYKLLIPLTLSLLVEAWQHLTRLTGQSEDDVAPTSCEGSPHAGTSPWGLRPAGSPWAWCMAGCRCSDKWGSSGSSQRAASGLWPGPTHPSPWRWLQGHVKTNTSVTVWPWWLVLPVIHSLFKSQEI